jgi:uncharacterized membrane protein (UPF0127 family)
MNLKRHHVLYALLAVSLIIALIIVLTPSVPHVSYTAPQQPDQASTTPAAATNAPNTMQFEVVTTAAAQEHGLGGRASIPENYGMLFVFPEDENVGFWMKDMLVPIDIIWLADTGAILGIEDSLSPSTYPQAYYPPKPVKYVLETKAGEARRQGWSIGSAVPLPAPYGLHSGS